MNNNFILINDTIYSLNNVMRVSISEMHDTKHTTMGKKYSLFHQHIVIDYENGKSNIILFKDYKYTDVLKKDVDEIFSQIFEKLVDND